MTATKRNIVIYQGDDIQISLPVPDLQPDELANSSVHLWPGGPLLATFTTEMDHIANTVTLKLTPSVSQLLTRDGVYDLELFSPTTGPRTIYSGITVVLPQVTRETSPSSNPTNDAWGIGDWDRFNWPHYEPLLLWGVGPWGPAPWG